MNQRQKYSIVSFSCLSSAFFIMLSNYLSITTTVALKRISFISAMNLSNIFYSILLSSYYSIVFFKKQNEKFVYWI